MNKKISVLGTTYTIVEATPEKDELLADCDGYCDKTARIIVITQKPKDSNLKEWKVYKNKVLRHEIIHAFLFESGLHENFKHEGWGHDETTVDWFAVQFPKIAAVYEKVGCLQ